MKKQAGIAVVAVLGVALLAYTQYDDTQRGPAPITLDPASANGEFSARVLPSDVDRVPAGVAASVTEANASRVAFESIKAAFAAHDMATTGRAIDAWFAAEPKPVEAILAFVGDANIDPLDAEIAGLLLQTAMVYSRANSDLVRPWTMTEIASTSVAMVDAGPRASRMLLIGLQPFGPELPAKCLVDLLHAARGETLNFSSYEAQHSALELIEEWARTMSTEVEGELYRMAANHDEGSLIRGDAVAGLLARDWRAFGPELKRMLDEQRSKLTDLTRNQLVLGLTAPNINLQPLERIELLRDAIGDEDVTIQAFFNMGDDEIANLALSVGARRGEWSGYDWIEMRSRGADWIDAGLRLLDRYENHTNRFVAYSVVEELLTAGGGDSQVQKVLEARFERRSQPNDPFWGAVAFNFDNLPRDVWAGSVRTWLVRTQGENHPQRKEILRKLQLKAPELVSGIT